MWAIESRRCVCTVYENWHRTLVRSYVRTHDHVCAVCVCAQLLSELHSRCVLRPFLCVYLYLMCTCVRRSTCHAAGAGGARRLEELHRRKTLTAEETAEAQRLMAAQRRAAEAADQLRTEELAREANERTMLLLPGLHELLAPTRDELRACLDKVTTVVMRNVEESARMLATVTVEKQTAISEATRAPMGTVR